jgi:hypothetical protein
MKQKDMLTIASLLSILLLLLHLTDDIIRGVSPAGPWTLIVVPAAALLLYGTLVLTERTTAILGIAPE